MVMSEVEKLANVCFLSYNPGSQMSYNLYLAKVEPVCTWIIWFEVKREINAEILHAA